MSGFMKFVSAVYALLFIALLVLAVLSLTGFFEHTAADGTRLMDPGL